MYTVCKGHGDHKIQYDHVKPKVGKKKKKGEKNEFKLSVTLKMPLWFTIEFDWDRTALKRGVEVGWVGVF